jgi:hypothetical protein
MGGFVSKLDGFIDGVFGREAHGWAIHASRGLCPWRYCLHILVLPKLAEEVSRKCEKECFYGVFSAKAFIASQGSVLRNSIAWKRYRVGPKHEYFDPCLQIGASLQRPLIDVTMCAGLCLISPLLLASFWNSRDLYVSLSLYPR